MFHEIFKGTAFFIHVIRKDKRTWSVMHGVPCAFQAKFLLGHFFYQPKLKSFSTISSCIPYSRIESRSSNMCESCLGSMMPNSSKSQCMSLLTVCTYKLSLSKLMVHHSSFGVAVAMVMIGCRSVRLLFLSSKLIKLAGCNYLLFKFQEKCDKDLQSFLQIIR